jgi:hypothetical protein
MASVRSLRLFALLQKEVQEYKLSLLLLPFILAGVLSVLMLLSVLLANRITAMGDTFLQVLMADQMGISPVITVNLGDDEDTNASPPEVVSSSDMRVENLAEPLPEEEWNFDREWRFEPQQRDKPEYESETVGSLNPALHLVHSLLMIVLVLVTISYLLGSLFNDRKDRSILFWKSMPVSEWEEVLTRLAIAVVVAPAIYIGVSLLLQLVFVLLSMLLVWRMELDPFEIIVGNIRVADLLVKQIGGWLMTALWVAPVYAWLMLASAWARRAPFMVAFAPVVALVLLERLLIGSDFTLTAVSNHLPHFIGGQSTGGFYFHSLFWEQFDFFSLFCGLVFAAASLAACVYLRRYRFEL